MFVTYTVRHILEDNPMPTTAPSTPLAASRSRALDEPGAAGGAMPTMRAITADRYGAPADVLRLRRVERTTPGKGEVLVSVAAAGLSRAALHLTTGTPYLVRLFGFGFRAPKHAMGIEVAGTVAAVGAGVERLAVGDQVFGYAPGACAEFAVARADKLALRPEGLDVVHAAALVDSASTALQAVRDHGRVQAGERVLVLGASGGVGSFAVQIAKAAGAEVTGTASTAKLLFVAGLGADHVVDHTAGDPLRVADGAPFDVILDLGGNRPVKALRQALTSTGRLVIVGGEGGGKLTGGFQRQILAPLRGVGSSQDLMTFVSTEHHRFLDDLAAMAVAGEIAVPIDRTHPIDEAPQGLARMEAGTLRGKDVVVIGP